MDYFLVAKRLSRSAGIAGRNFDAYRISAQQLGDLIGSARSGERIKHQIARNGEKFNEPFGQRPRECRAVIFVSALCCEMQYVIGVGQFAPNPVGDVLPKAGSNAAVESHYVVGAEPAQTFSGPVTHWHHHRLLIHVKMAGLIELEAALPGVAEAVRPFAGMAVLFMPDELLRPEPSLLSHF